MLRPHQTLCRAAKLNKSGPTKSSERRLIIPLRATPKKCGAVKDELFPAFILRRSAARRSAARRGAARHSAAQRSAACSVAPAKINSTVYPFLKAQRGAARRLVGP